MFCLSKEKDEHDLIVGYDYDDVKDDWLDAFDKQTNKKGIKNNDALIKTLLQVTQDSQKNTITCEWKLLFEWWSNQEVGCLCIDASNGLVFESFPKIGI